jgi:hypothetical protein
MKLYNKKLFLRFNDFFKTNAEYFKIILFKGKQYFYFNENNDISCIDFSGIKIKMTVLKNVFNSGFEIIEKDNELYLFVGSQDHRVYKNVKKNFNFKNSDKNIFLKNRVTRENDLVPSHLYDLDYPINGIYIYKSNDGLHWNKIVNSPVMHRVFSSDNIKMGEIDFDTKPSIIKFNGEYIYYGRLNTSRQERRIYLRKSKDLLSWDEPVKINIINETEHNDEIKNNFYHLVPFIYNNRLFAFVPFFKAILLKTHNNYRDSCTLIMESCDGINWLIKGNILRFTDKYKSRVNDVKVINNKILFYTRENINQPNPIFCKYNFDL